MAIAILANHPARLSPEQISENVDHIKAMKNLKELKALMNNLRMAVEEMRKSFGATISRQQALSEMAWIERTIEPNQACCMPAGMLADDFAI
ncbi:MAG TPA: hypothetical protein VGP62_29920 [Bryobacteraceae bacterium]|nr:hypothetical protein [Bryobacteraceae bacterium]